MRATLLNLFAVCLLSALLFGLMLVIFACTNVREGSVLVISRPSGTNGAPGVITAAANGANAQAAGNHSPLDAKGSASQSFASKWYLWVIVGVAAVLVGWLVWKFVFTGAKLSILG
jgi:uncharacterized Tic20 family protein